MEGVLQAKLVSFYPSNGSFLPNTIFLLLSFMFIFLNILGTLNLQKKDWQNKSN